MPNSVTATATTAASTTTASPQTVVANDNNPTATANANTAAVKSGTAVDTGGNAITGFGTPSASTTTISNGNKINQVPGIQSTTDGLTKTGISTNANGTATYANGTVYDPTQPTSSANVAPTAPTSDLSQPGISQGGYYGETYYAPGSPLPIGQNGLPVTLTPNSPVNQGILDSLNQAKASADALTASVIDNIKSSYANLVEQQKRSNAGAQAGVENSLLKGGVTGSGSSSQYAQISSSGIIQSQISYGLSQIADLQSKENDAIIKAQQAGQDLNFKLMSSINDEIKSVRDEKVKAAQDLNEKIQAQNQKIADAKLQQTKDDFVASQLQNGVTDPQAILKNAKDQGLTISASEVGAAMKNLSPDKDAIDNLAAKAAEAGADAATVAKITNSANLNDALTIATPALGAKVANDLKQQAFDNSIKQQTLKLDSQRVAIEQENANTNLAKLRLDQSSAAQAAVNAVVTTPSGKKYVDGTNLDASGKVAALKAGQVVLDGDSAKAMASISNMQGQLGGLLTSLQTAGVVDQNGSFTGKGVTAGFTHMWQAGAATPAIRNFTSSLVGTKNDGIISQLQKLPGTGDLVSTLNNNVPKDTDSQDQLKTKITNITTALEGAENSFLINGSTPQEGSTGTIMVDGKPVTATYTNGQWTY